MLDPIQNPNISHQLNQSHITKKHQQKRFADEKLEEARKTELEQLSDTNPWWRVMTLSGLQKFSKKPSKNDIADDRVFAAIQAIIQNKGSLRPIIALIAKRIQQLGYERLNEVFEKANYFISPYCPPIDIQKFQKQFHISYLKFQKDQALGNWVISAQNGNQEIFRNLLHQLRLILIDFFNLHYKGLFDVSKISDDILILVDKALPTYTSSQSFFTWFFAIVKAKLTTLPSIRKNHKTLINQNVAVTESRLAHLSIHQMEGFQNARYH